MKNKNNHIVVLIPHFNDLNGLEKSLKSIQEDFLIDVLIVDDGSKEKPNETQLNNWYKKGKVILKNLEINQGIEFALNKGLVEIQKLGYKIIGRLDCGDICLPHRFKSQLAYLKNNPQVKLLGTQVRFVDGNYNYLYTSNFPVTYKEIKRRFFVNCMLVHPTVIFYTHLLSDVGLYPTNYQAAEDYALFIKIVKKYETHNLEQVYLDKVIDNKSISTQKRKKQVFNKIRIIKDNFYFGIFPIYGLIRNTFLYFFPRKIVYTIKTIIQK
ncbi:MAG: glycosyltransferase [Flavobacteriales bacterium]